jgi:hypothetical protein
MGAWLLADAFVLNEFWVFASFQHGLVHAYFDALQRHATHDTVERLLELPPGTMWWELLKLYEGVESLRERKGTPVRFLCGALKPFRLCGGSVQVQVLTPSHDHLWNYHGQMNRAIQFLARRRAESKSQRPSPRVLHNQASAAFLIEYGTTRILLMADAEEALWHAWQAETAALFFPPVQFLKVGHHGSANGCVDAVYRRFADHELTTAVLTPFDRHQSPLPSLDGVRCIRRHVRELYCTNRVAAAESSRRRWRPAGEPPTPPPLPASWARACIENPDLLRLLAVEGRSRSSPMAQVRLPTLWAKDCLRRPDLFQLLHPEVRNRRVLPTRATVADEFRVSVYYDDRGQEVERYIGWGVGRL